LVASHHSAPSKDNPLLSYLIRADHLSAQERMKRESEEKGDFKKAPLISIFSKMDGKGVADEGSGYYRPQALKLTEDVIFPMKEKLPSGQWSLEPDYHDLWESFLNEAKQLISDDLDLTFIQLYCLLPKYTSFMPSATYVDVPTVSLFDHLKTTAALARCLYETKGKEEFLLVGGDVSGIQSFIYSIVDEGATKQLRGRSLYLNLLTEAVAKHILRALKLPLCNILYTGGGRFQILAPSTPEIEHKLEECRRHISSTIYKRHRTDLYLAIEWVRWTPDEHGHTEGDDQTGFDAAMRALGDALSFRKRNRKFIEVIEDDPSFFTPRAEDVSSVCKLCGREYPEGLDESGRCKLCASFTTLASKLVESDYLVEVWRAPNPHISGLPFEELGFGFELVSKRGLEKVRHISADAVFVRKINSYAWTHMDTTGYQSPIILDTTFLAKTVAHNVDGSIKTFDEMAEGDSTSRGLKTWAALRMDVDNLGTKFKGSVSKRATLSRMLSLFFCGWVDTIAQRYPNIYVVYSGGDDLFLAGRWDEVLEVAKTIRADFKRYTCTNPEWSISGGIFIAPSKKHPLRSAATEAGESLENSKHHDESGKVKDSITVLNTTCFWDEYVEGVEKLASRIEEELSEGARRAFLRKLYAVFSTYERYAKKMHDERYDDRYGRWGWLLSYILAKEPWLKERSKRDNFEQQIGENIRFLGLTTRLVELRTRGE